MPSILLGRTHYTTRSIHFKNKVCHVQVLAYRRQENSFTVAESQLGMRPNPESTPYALDLNRCQIPCFALLRLDIAGFAFAVESLDPICGLDPI